MMGFHLNYHLCLTYPGDHLASLVTSVGRGTLLVKADIKEAYRMVPIHPNDQYLLEICIY